MKKAFLVFASVFLSANLAWAKPKHKPLECDAGKTAKSNGYTGLTILKINEDVLSYSISNDQHQTENGTAERDTKFDANGQYRYLVVNAPNKVLLSDGDVAIFADKAMANGGTGRVSVSTQIICDGDNCRASLAWGSEGSFTCD